MMGNRVMMKTINRIMNSYFRFFKIKDLNLQVILTNDMYETQKKYGFSEEKIRSLDEKTARKNWKHVAACMKYYKVKFVRFSDLLMRLKEAEDESHYLKELKEYINPRLLILDEWLMNPITNAEARYVLDLIHKRRRKSSTIFCSQYEDSGWYAQLGGDETPLADSIMDRIAYDSYKINIRAKDPKNDRSMREVYGIRPEERQ